jgi:hypothetical protein
MQTWGGSFVKALSQCIVLADPDNLEKIKLAWPDYWAKYSARAEKIKGEEAGDS